MIKETPIKTYPNPNARSLDLILKQKANFVVGCWLTYTCIIIFMFYVMNEKINTFTVGIPLFFLFFIICYRKASFKSHDYYSLPGSTIDLDIHKCVYCGYDKIEIEKSLISKIHKCSSCQEFLYSE